MNKNSIKSLSFLWLGSLLGSGSTFVIYVLLARYLGVEEFGIFSSAIAIITVLSLISGFGVSQAWLKHFGKEGWNAVRWISASFKLATISIFIVLFILIIWATFGPNDLESKKILYILSFFIIGQMITELVSVKFQLEENYSYLALWQVLPNLLRLSIICFFVYIFQYKSFDVITVAYIYSCVAIVFILIGINQLLKMKKYEFDLKGHGNKIMNFTKIPNIKETFSHSWAFGLGNIFAFIYLQSDIIMLKYISGNEAAGYYNVGFIIISAILIFPTVLYSKFLMPKYHRWVNQDKNKFYEYYKKGNLLMFVFGMIFLIFVLIFSDFFIPILFGQEYVKSILFVQILSISLPIYFVAYSVGATLVTKEYMKYKVQLMGITGLVNIILNAILIPLYSEIGAAIATIVSNLILLMFYYIVAEKKIFKKDLYVENY
ncbi:MAG: flippase [Arcobacter sp.]|uniref:flippase n=1 Tax=Arcobacter sp. TaxID=1872629 RepID=UPI003CFD07F8